MRAVSVILAGVLLIPPGPAVAAPAPTDPLVARLEQIFTDQRLVGATVAVEVREAVGGRVVYQHDPDVRVLPASNQKLLTAAAALEVLGAGYRFRTTVRGHGRVLYLRGQGDPTLTYERIDRLAAAVARAGAKRYARLIVDDTWFDRVPLGLDWSWQDESYGFTAPVSALSFAANERFDNAAVEIRYRGVAGRRPTVRVWPPTGSVRVINRAVTRSGDSVGAVRAHGRAVVTLSGSVAAGRSGSALVSVPDPAATAAGLFRAALRRHGVTVSGPTSRGVTPGGTRAVAAQVSRPLAEILPPFLKLSNNGIAELLVKAMSRAADPARPGSWPTGLAAATGALGRLGVDTRLLTMGDGSGLSRRNWVTARQVTTVLEKAQRRTWFPTFRAALPVAGSADPMVGGTLRNRMRGTAAAGNVRAKTGTLSGVNALSGYVTGAGGRRLAFTFIVNASVDTAAPLLDEAAVALATV
ncbi:D-alanyl-D-alanine carboxypeptidase/D-alanyl-D-alanine endopeptidase [Actinoplanes sichuanensis]|uniref:D-alanyl-D-alanine carboxypeptidase/D-alanyl-D-alanine-endopeptidase n=1 Tax=Actinoplanes sichuanensis TaxID=512349 RepID=A0ABW4AGC5_9ACTN|nr:D-alanyl-D-alanine carboxypeptidase/D-alanyl-D-alanine-endopeptidase [Actinoplanes sichuanensis]